MKSTNKFGKKIKYQEILSRVAYISLKSELIDQKLYESMEFPEVEVKTKPSLEGPRKQYPYSYRKLVFDEELGEGIIIGQTKRMEGQYNPSIGSSFNGDGMSEAEAAYLEVKNTYAFWVVATEMNRTVLIPKEL